MATTGVVRLAAIGDLHCAKTSQGMLQPLLAQVSDLADVLALCGDLTDHGLPDEMKVFLKELSPALKIPILAVLGNHDCHSGQEQALEQLLLDAGIKVLDGEACEIHGIGFAGVKGFAGGFGRRILEPWGEDAVKHFVRHAVDEAVKLESALARLRTPQRVAVLHYAPIQATVEGEPPEIYPFLGCSRLEEPLNRHGVVAVFHGHAHHGAPEGRTSANIPVYNVSMSLLRRSYPDRPPFRVVEIPVVPQEER